MKHLLLAGVALLATMPLPALAQRVAVVHATAWTMTAAEPVKDATIVIDQGHIVSVEAGGAAPEGARIMDAGGHIVTPGLVNAATQLGLIEVSSAAATRDQTSVAHGIGAGFDIVPAINPNSALVALARADGITGAFTFPQASDEAPFAGMAALLKLREGPDILDRPGAAMVVVIGGNKWPKDAGSRAAQWQMLRRAFGHAVDEHREAGGDDHGKRGKGPPHGDHQEGHGGPPPGTDDAAILSVLAGEAPLAIFTDRESDIREAVRFGAEFKVRIVIVGGGEAWRAVDVLGPAKIPVVLDPQADMPGSFDELGNRLDAAAMLQKAGVPVAFGMTGGAIVASYNAGIELREGAGIAVANGLPYAEALRAMTVTPHAIWGGGAGTLAPGQSADLVIWDGDPLEPATNPLTILIEGQAVHRDNRQLALGRRYLPLATEK